MPVDLDLVSPSGLVAAKLADAKAKKGDISRRIPMIPNRRYIFSCEPELRRLFAASSAPVLDFAHGH